MSTTNKKKLDRKLDIIITSKYIFLFVIQAYIILVKPIFKQYLPLFDQIILYCSTSLICLRSQIPKQSVKMLQVKDPIESINSEISIQNVVGLKLSQLIFKLLNIDMTKTITNIMYPKILDLGNRSLNYVSFNSIWKMILQQDNLTILMTYQMFQEGVSSDKVTIKQLSKHNIQMVLSHLSKIQFQSQKIMISPLIYLQVKNKNPISRQIFDKQQKVEQINNIFNIIKIINYQNEYKAKKTMGPVFLSLLCSQLLVKLFFYLIFIDFYYHFIYYFRSFILQMDQYLDFGVAILLLFLINNLSILQENIYFFFTQIFVQVLYTIYYNPLYDYLVLVKNYIDSIQINYAFFASQFIFFPVFFMNFNDVVILIKNLSRQVIII